MCRSRKLRSKVCGIQQRLSAWDPRFVGSHIILAVAGSKIFRIFGQTEKGSRIQQDPGSMYDPADQDLGCYWDLAICLVRTTQSKCSKDIREHTKKKQRTSENKQWTLSPAKRQSSTSTCCRLKRANLGQYLLLVVLVSDECVNTANEATSLFVAAPFCVIVLTRRLVALTIVPRL